MPNSNPHGKTTPATPALPPGPGPVAPDLSLRRDFLLAGGLTAALVLACTAAAALVLLLGSRPSGPRLPGGPASQPPRLWDAARDEKRPASGADASAVRWVVFSPDGRALLSSAYHEGFRLWDASKGVVLFQWPLRPRGEDVPFPCYTACFVGDARKLVFAASPSDLSLRDAGTGEEAARLRPSLGQIGTVAVSADGTRLVVRALEENRTKRVLRVLDLATNRPLWSAEEPDTNAGMLISTQNLVFSPDGALLASSECSLVGRQASIDNWRGTCSLDR